ncbi:MAG: alpha-2-macroglobulin family protein, partial [Planctomycetota bacterium]
MELFLKAPIRCRGFLTIESDRFHLVRRIDFERPVRIVTLDIDASFAPRAIVKLVGFRGVVCNSEGAEIFVLPHENRLNVALSADRREYQPRETAKIHIATGQSAEVELAIVDQAVFEMEPDSVPDPFEFFFAARLHETAVYGSFDGVGDEWGAWDLEELEEAMFGGAAGEDGGGPVRRNFPDTMFYAGRVQTDDAGRATVEVPVPDSLTRWVIVARAVAGVDRFGVGRSEILTRKDVITRISAPRFLTIGDETEIGVIVHNHLDKANEFAVSFGEQEHRVSIEAGGHKRLGWKLRADAVGDLKLLAAAVSPAGGDTVQITLPVLPRTEAVTDRFGSKVETEWRQRLEPGEIEILVGGSHQEAIRDALPYLVGYPYGCVEQTMSRFLPAVVATKAMSGAGMRVAKALPDLVSIGLTRLYDFQHDDGGWGWWHDDATHDWMTAYVVSGLMAARDAGVAVDERTIERGLDALREMQEEPTPFALYVRSLAGEKIDPKLVPEPKSVRDRAYLALAGLKELGGLRDFKPRRASDVALVLRARAKEKDGAAEVARWSEWLLSHRRGGRWKSTLDTAHAILALSRVRLPHATPGGEVTLGGKPLALKDGRAVLQLSEPADLIVTRSGGSPMFASAVRRYHAEPKAFAHESFAIERHFEKRVGDEWQPVAAGGSVAVGDAVRLVVTIDVKRQCEFVMIDVPLPGGVETSLSLADDFEPWFGHLEARDDRLEIAAEHLGRGKQTLTL